MTENENKELTEQSETPDKEEETKVSSFSKGLSSLANTISKGIDFTASKISGAKDDIDKDKYRPIFAEKMESLEDPLILNIMTSDERQNIDVCQGAVAYLPIIGRTKVLEMTRENLEHYGYELVPYEDAILYIRNPYIAKQYIAIDEYFTYLRNQKAQELVTILPLLKARSATVELYKEKKSLAFIRSDEEDKQEAGSNAYVSDNPEEMVFYGLYKQNSQEKTDELCYYNHNLQISEYIENPQRAETILIDVCQSADLSDEEAIDIDLALEKMYLSTRYSFRKELEEERLLKFLVSYKFRNNTKKQ